MKMRKLIAVLCLVCCVFSFSTVAFAAGKPEENKIIENSTVVPTKMANIDSSLNRLTIRNGVASIRAYVYGYSGLATKCEVAVKLQVKTLGLFWTTVGTWNDSRHGDYAAVSGTATVTTGKSYRTVATVTVWNGSSAESRTLTSETVVA